MSTRGEEKRPPARRHLPSCPGVAFVWPNRVFILPVLYVAVRFCFCAATSRAREARASHQQ